MKIQFKITKSNVVFVLIFTVLFLSLLFFLNRMGFVANSGSGFENFSIDDASDKNILEKNIYYTSYRDKYNKSGERSGFSSILYENEDYDKVTYSTKNITGIKTISATLADGCTVELDINVKLSSGVAKLAIVTEDKIIDCIGIEGEASFKYTVTEANKVFVKILCEDAKIEITSVRRISIE